MLRSKDKTINVKGNAAHITETGDGMGRRSKFMRREARIAYMSSKSFGNE